MKKIIFVTIIAILLLSLFWIGSIVKCEIITVQHGNEFLLFKEVSTASKFEILTYTNDFGDFAKENYSHVRKLLGLE